MTLWQPDGEQKAFDALGKQLQVEPARKLNELTKAAFLMEYKGNRPEHIGEESPVIDVTGWSWVNLFLDVTYSNIAPYFDAKYLRIDPLGGIDLHDQTRWYNLGGSDLYLWQDPSFSWKYVRTFAYTNIFLTSYFLGYPDPTAELSFVVRVDCSFVEKFKINVSSREKVFARIYYNLQR